MFIIFYKSIPAYPPTDLPTSYLGTSKAHWNVGCFENEVGWAKDGGIAKMAYKKRRDISAKIRSPCFHHQFGYVDPGEGAIF